MYSDHPHLVKCFLNNRKQDGSIKSFFSDFMKSHLGKTTKGKTTKYGRELIVANIFYEGDPSKNRGLLKDFEESMTSGSDDMLRAEADDQAVINLLNDYIDRLDLRRNENRFRLKTLMIIFLMRSFSNKYYKLIMKKEYSDLLKDTYIGIYRAKCTIYTEMRDLILKAASGDLKKVPKLSSDVKFIVEHFMHSKTPIDPDFLLSVPDEDEFEVQDNIVSTLKELGIALLTERRERIITSKNFPYLEPKQLAIISDIVKEYRAMWTRFTPFVNANILVEAIGISYNSYDNYKSKVSSELIKLSNQNSYEDITAYLLEDSEDD